MRIAILKSRRFPLSRDASYDGGSIHVSRQIEWLLADGHRVDAFTRREDHSERDYEELRERLALWRVGFEQSKSGNIFVRDFEEGKSFVEGVHCCPGFSAAQYDLIIVHHWTSGVGLFDYVASKVPVVFTPHLLPSEKALHNNSNLPQSVRALERSLLEQSNLVVAVSEAEALSCRELASVQKLIVVPNGVSEEFFRTPLTVTSMSFNSPKTIGSVGRVCRQKGTDVLVDAFIQLRKNGLNVRLQIVGGDYGEGNLLLDLKAKLLKANCNEYVTFHGLVPNSSLSKLMVGWDVYAQPSRYESQGIAILEAMASGRTMVTTKLPAIDEYLPDEISYKVDLPLNVKDLKTQLTEALQSKEVSELSQRTRSIARGFSWQAAREKMMACLEAMVRPSSRLVRPDVWGGELELACKTVLEDARKGIECILLVGSAVRGGRKPGSDFDFITVDQSKHSVSQSWTVRNGLPYDIRHVGVQYLEALLLASPANFAEMQLHQPIIDYLMKCQVIKCNDRGILELIERLKSYRLCPEVVTGMQQTRLRLATVHFKKALNFADKELRAIAQVEINSGAQAFLEAELIGAGWFVSGAKRRLETASAYYESFTSVRTAADFSVVAMGVDQVSISVGLELSKARLSLRHAHSECLANILNAKAADFQVAHQHSFGAIDYYEPAIQDGYLKGSIAHMRSFSGVPKMPEVYRKALHEKNRTCDFLENDLIDAEVRHLWQKVMNPMELLDIKSLAVEGQLLSSERRGGV